MSLATHNQMLHTILVSTVAELEQEYQTLTTALETARQAHQLATQRARIESDGLTLMDRAAAVYQKTAVLRMRVRGSLRDTRHEMLRVERQLPQLHSSLTV